MQEHLTVSEADHVPPTIDIEDLPRPAFIADFEYFENDDCLLTLVASNTLARQAMDPAGVGPVVTDVMQYIHPSDRPYAETHIQHALRVNKPVEATVRVKFDQGYRWIHVSGNPLQRKDRPNRVLLEFTDVTQAIVTSFVANELNAIANLDQVLSDTEGILRELTDFDSGALLVLGSQGTIVAKQIWPKDGVDRFPEVIVPGETHYEQYPIMQQAAATRQPLAIPNVTQDTRWVGNPASPERQWPALLGVALHNGEPGAPLGFLFLNKKDGAFSKADEEILGIIAPLLSTALHRARELHAQKDLALLDGLTGLPNRRSFNTYVQELKTEKRLGYRPSGIGFLDPDYFKTINDTYGHPEGDEVLRETANFLRQHLRHDQEKVFRYGGDEFALFFGHGMTPEQVADKAGGIRTSFTEHMRKVFPGLQHQFTLSIGFVPIEQHIQLSRIDDIVGLADQALYRAKHEGRNRIVGLMVPQYP